MSVSAQAMPDMVIVKNGTLDEGLSPAPETIDEVKLQTSLYDASTGRSGGGNFQIVTKSGTNAFSGRSLSTSAP